VLIGNIWQNIPSSLQNLPGWLIPSIDVILVIGLTFLVLLAATDRRTVWIVRGLAILVFTAAVCQQVQLRLLSFVLEKLSIGAALAMAIIFQSEFRRLLEQIGRGEIRQLWQARRRQTNTGDRTIDRLVDAVKDLAQTRTGALIIIETTATVDERDFAVAGVRIDAELSKELLQTVFQTTTILHDGAVFVRGNRIISAGVILPLSDRPTSRKLGTRHRAAMGISERLPHCLCIVVSEETGTISLAEKGNIERPIALPALRDFLIERLSLASDPEPTSARRVKTRKWWQLRRR
jgi:uncharacterized protein (TIGR00159 family)